MPARDWLTEPSAEQITGRNIVAAVWASLRGLDRSPDCFMALGFGPDPNRFIKALENEMVLDLSRSPGRDHWKETPGGWKRTRYRNVGRLANR